MATAKKPISKKSTPKRKPAAKKTTAKKASTSNEMQSFKIAPNEPPFFSVRITKQTVYWSVLLIVILVAQLMVLNAQLDVIQSLDALEAIQ